MMPQESFDKQEFRESKVVYQKDYNAKNIVKQRDIAHKLADCSS